MATACGAGCYAAGIESIDFNGPSLEIGKAAYEKNQEVLKQAEDSFQNSELLQKLKAQSEENKSKCEAMNCKACKQKLGKIYSEMVNFVLLV